jgi:hypothetical protein
MKYDAGFLVWGKSGNSPIVKGRNTAPLSFELAKLVENGSVALLAGSVWMASAILF